MAHSLTSQITHMFSSTQGVTVAVKAGGGLKISLRTPRDSSANGLELVKLISS